MFWERFYSLCEKANIKPNPLAKQLGISSGVLNKWKNGGIPNSNALIKIADYFSVSIDYLLGRTDNFHSNDKEQSENNLSSDEKKLIDIYNGISDDDKILLMAFGLQLQRNMPILNVVNKPTKQDTEEELRVVARGEGLTTIKANASDIDDDIKKHIHMEQIKTVINMNQRVHLKKVFQKKIKLMTYIATSQLAWLEKQFLVLMGLRLLNKFTKRGHSYG